MPLALLYHDVVPLGQEDASGFPGAGAARYKLSPEAFRAHLDVIKAAVTSGPLAEGPITPSVGQWLLTFDDGGASSLSPIADLLEERGWRGHFFITTDHLDRPSFLTPAQVRQLRQRGHVIGSHSSSHPERISYCSPAQLLEEWTRSRAALEDILGEKVESGSVPGGFYSRQVAEAANRAGLRLLFTSEPTTGISTVGACQIVGRYAIFRETSPQRAAALAAGKLLPRLGQSVAWTLKKAAKVAGGRFYLRFRDTILRRTYAEAGR